jgi:hypothetical protein
MRIRDRVATWTEGSPPARWAFDRLGPEPLTIDASHSPFLSRPGDLAQLLVAATDTRPVGPLIPN